MIKITCIVGSARNNGSSAYLVDQFISGLNEGAVVKNIALVILTSISVLAASTVTLMVIAYITTM